MENHYYFKTKEDAPILTFKMFTKTYGDDNYALYKYYFDLLKDKLSAVEFCGNLWRRDVVCNFINSDNWESLSKEVFERFLFQNAIDLNSTYFSYKNNNYHFFLNSDNEVVFHEECRRKKYHRTIQRIIQHSDINSIIGNKLKNTIIKGKNYFGEEINEPLREKHSFYWLSHRYSGYDRYYHGDQKVRK